MLRFLKRTLFLLISFMLYSPLLALTLPDGLEVSEYLIKSKKVPESFDGYRIVHLSDFHNSLYQLHCDDCFFDIVKLQDPDIIVLTGDMLDVEALSDASIGVDNLKTTSWIKKLQSIAPIYYIYGNNDYFKDEQKQLSYEKSLKNAGVIILRDESTLIQKDGQSIQLIGLNDPISLKKFAPQEINRVKQQLKNTFAEKNKDKFSILLAHRPEYIELYSHYSPDLVLSGHTHGGQVKINGKSALIPGQDKNNPLYIDGLYDVFGTKMIINKGLGTSGVSIRLNCPIEIGVITLHKEK